MSGIRRLGEGYEPHVDEFAGTLTYSLPVESGFVSMDFSFDISTDDLTVLVSDNYRRAALEVIAHTVLQRSMLQGSARVSQSAFDSLVSQVLHSAPKALDRYIDRISRDHNIAVRLFIEQVMARQADG